MKTISIVNQKGGVGKSSTATALASGLKLKGFRTLIIDLDAQRNTTYTYNALNTEESVIDILTEEATAEEAIYHAEAGDIIPGHRSLGLLTDKGTDTDYAISRTALKEALEPLHQKYDYCIIDTPPALSILLINALIASNSAVIPALADIYSVQGIKELFTTIEAVKKISPGLAVEGILLTQYTDRTLIAKYGKATLQQLAEQYNTKVFNTTIRRSVAVQEAQISQKDLYSYSGKSKPAMDYIAFIDELLKR